MASGIHPALIAMVAPVWSGSAAALPAPFLVTAPQIADDAERWFQDARAAVAAGDLAGAIADLERVLLANPDLANVKLELGLLYLRVGQADLARDYLEAAIASPEAPEASRVRAGEALRQATGSLRRFSASGLLQFGTQYQSNPNGSPGSVSLVGPGGVPIVLDSDQLSLTRGHDVSGSIAASSEMRYALGGQRGPSLVATFAGAYTRYADQTEINTLYLAGQVGPRLALGSTLAPKALVRPYGEIIYLGLGDARYFTGYGGGLSFSWMLGPAVQLTSQASYNRRDYNSSRDRPAAAEQTGDYVTGTADLLFQVSTRTLVDVGGLGERGDARRAYWSRWTYGGSVSVVQNISAFGTGLIGRLGFGYRRSHYDEADPLVDPSRSRRERRYEVSGGVSVPLQRRLTLDLVVQRQWNPANLPNYDYRNTFASAGLSYRY